MPAHDAHARLAAHDPAVGSLRLLLGTDELAERLGTPVTRGYLRYKPGTSATALLDVDGRSAIGYAWGPSREEKRHKAVRRVTAEDVLLDDPDAGLLVVDARTDRHLKALRTRVRAWPGGTHTLAHKPARRWVGRSGPRVLRVYARSGYARALAGHAAVLADGGGGSGFRLPQVLERDDAGLIVLRHLPGSTLGATVGEPELRRLGACLGAFHTKGVDRAAPCVEPPVGTHRALRALEPVLPGTADAAADIEASARDSLRPGPVGLVHGDLSLDQVVADGHDLGLIDLDRAGRGNPLDDIASLLAVLVLDRLSAGACAHAAPGTVAQAAVPLLAGHGSTGPAGLGDDLGPRVALQLLARALEPFRAGHPMWPELTTQVLAAAEELGRWRW